MTFFSFYHVNPDKMLKILQNIDSKKATQQGDIPVGIKKEDKFTFFKFTFYLFYLKLKGALSRQRQFLATEAL